MGADVVAAAGVSTTPNQVHDVSAALRIPIDSKAMRKFESKEVMVGVIEVGEVSAATLRIFVNSRFLAKLA